MAGKPKEYGAASQRVARNVRRIRQHRDMTAAALSARLAEIGHPIVDTGILKIEHGDRRVDVDDLMALAEALGVEPAALLLGEVTVSVAVPQDHHGEGSES